MKSLILIAAFAVPTLMFANPVSAEPVPARLTVSTAGLDLSTAKGVRSLDLRILHAASALCGVPSPSDARGRPNYENCRAKARAAASSKREQLLAAARGRVEVAVAE